MNLCPLHVVKLLKIMRPRMIRPLLIPNKTAIAISSTLNHKKITNLHLRLNGKKQAAHVWSPSVCDSQWGAGKNELMAKSFFAKNHVKIAKSQPPLRRDGQNCENVICN